jgi:hypothetical protein
MATRLPQKISELQGDVNITSPTDGQVLKYDAASGKWIDATDEVNSASEMLAELLTVDGAGSGLDADKLDGQEGSYYAADTDLNAHTDADNPHSGSASNTDLNAHTDASNPHSGSASNTDLNAHTDDTGNPHSVTASQVEAVPATGGFPLLKTVVDSGTTLVVPDTHVLIVPPSFAVNGTLTLDGDSQLYILT